MTTRPAETQEMERPWPVAASHGARRRSCRARGVRGRPGCHGHL